MHGETRQQFSTFGIYTHLLLLLVSLGWVHGTWWETSSYWHSSSWCTCRKGPSLFIYCLWVGLCLRECDACISFNTCFSFELFNPVMLDIFLTFLIFFMWYYSFMYDLQCRAFAKALHYKEMEFEGARFTKMDANPVSVVEALIHINNQLHQHEVYFKNWFLFEPTSWLLLSCFWLCWLCITIKHLLL